MSRLSRITQVIFGNGASDIGVFGSAAVGTPTLSTVIATIMASAGWAGGWLSAVLGATKLPAVEDLNAVTYVTTTQLAYLFQQGIAEYDAGTTYYTHNVCMQAGTYNVYGSAADNNTGNALTNPTYWTFLGSLASLASSNLYIGGTTTGAANAQVIPSLSPSAGFSLANNGQTILCTAGFTNTGAMTVAVTTPTIAATSVKVNSVGGLIDPPAGAVTAGNMMALTVDSGAGVLVLDVGLPATLFLQKGNNLSELTATAATARSNISAAQSGANTDITSLNGSALIYTPYGVGSFIQATTTSTHTGGSTVSASSLTAALADVAPEGSSGPADGGDSLTGTWQCLQTMSQSGINVIANWQRIA